MDYVTAQIIIENEVNEKLIKLVSKEKYKDPTSKISKKALIIKILKENIDRYLE